MVCVVVDVDFFLTLLSSSVSLFLLPRLLLPKIRHALGPVPSDNVRRRPGARWRRRPERRRAPRAPERVRQAPRARARRPPEQAPDSRRSRRDRRGHLGRRCYRHLFRRRRRCLYSLRERRRRCPSCCCCRGGPRGMRGKLPYDSGKRGRSIGSRKRVGLSGETADFFSSFTIFFIPSPPPSCPRCPSSNIEQHNKHNKHTQQHTKQQQHQRAPLQRRRSVASNFPVLFSGWIGQRFPLF